MQCLIDNKTDLNRFVIDEVCMRAHSELGFMQVGY